MLVGTNACSDGTLDIVTEAMCVDAAAAMGLFFMGVLWDMPTLPANCYMTVAQINSLLQ